MAHSQLTKKSQVISLLRAIDILEPELAAGAADFLDWETLDAGFEEE